METETYEFVGGPLHGQTAEFGGGTASWWGFRYSKDGVEGEYNTVPCGALGDMDEGTYLREPYRLYWSDVNNRQMKPDWELSGPVDDLDGEALEEHIAKLIEAQSGKQGR